MSTIILLGNGFDLKSGLISSYKSFFDWYSNRYNTDFRYWHHLSKSNGLPLTIKLDEKTTVWNYYFITQQINLNQNWSDIEKEILESMNSFWVETLDLINVINNNSFSKTPSPAHNNLKLANEIIDKYFPHIKNRFFSTLPLEYRRSLEGSDKISTTEFFEILLIELKLFENQFGQFIKDCIEICPEYLENQKKLLIRILDKTTKNGIGDTKILTFNYTSLPSQALNLHGKVEDQPIFGINESSNSNKDLVVFTKRYRREESNLNMIGEFIESDEDHSIIFYGCSLNDMDYDYYETVLNWNQNKKIYFCYSNYDNSDRKMEQVRLAKKLIDKARNNKFNIMRERNQIQFIEI
ncbi:MAG: bacteriophage abortive infection AbiH family protein [Erysipelotrichales bacterium]|nr:bacteriophage abortive infection AbiH family protein [Erysipelotrichales bacterium]